ncbi:DNA recombination protein RmuC [Paroceanicella profunda]|uniref:DNA recombination protein RmuC homolog n=1 Tax=Paroceanicella profunda TaxID=2579971 RepID=A0A5B8FH61_9RHOB|nr:DNA recombination protein RmuC [Paroceanicella profunda]QDL91817.1 DNA recombination protein RmuC [Paroceanicella profunda]
MTALPETLPLAWVLAGAVTLLLLALLLRPRRDTGAEARALTEAVIGLDTAIRRLDQGQSQLAGGLRSVSEAQAAAQARMAEMMERRLEEVQKGMTVTLHGTATRTARSLGDLQQRLEAIDRAQSKIEKLSGDVLGLQDILSNKQARGAFGEIQLADIVGNALPPDAYTLQATLSNGRRADCLLHLPNPPGTIAIDSKFPLEAWEGLRAARTEREREEAARHFRLAVRHHLRAISERYIIEGETADSALMFLPSEAVYAELHANFSEVVREGFELRVWIVSPTTCMATLNTLRAILKDARMREQAGAIRRELGLLHKDMERLVDRVGNLDRHFDQAARDVEEIKVSATKAGNRALKLEAFDFDTAAAEAPRPAVAVPQRR